MENGTTPLNLALRNIDQVNVSQSLITIRAVHRGRAFVDLDLGGAAPARLDTAGTPALSQREREVLALLAQGHNNQVIADRLFLSVKTIETYRTRIADKLGLKTHADLVRYALEMGILASGKTDPE